MNPVKEHLQQMTDMMRKSRNIMSTYEFVLKYGQEFRPSFDSPEGIKRQQVKECFRNAFQTMLDNPELIYVEGYACGVLPVHHAWCATQEGTVVEVTWSPKIASQVPAYFGIPFDREFVIQTAVAKETYGLLDDWQNEWPLENGKHENWRYEE